MSLKDLGSSIHDGCKAFGEKLDANASPIYIGLGLLAFGTAIVVASVEAPKAKKSIDRARADLKDIKHDLEDGYITEESAKLARKDVAIDLTKDICKFYVPVVVLAASGTFCIVNAHNIDTNKIAGLTTAYQISEAARKEYKNKVIETIGDKKEQKIRDEINKDKVKRNPVDNGKVVLVDNQKPTQLFMDALSGRYFRTDVDHIKACVNDLNRDMLDDGYVTLNEFYDKLNLPDIQLGRDLGWRAEEGLIELLPFTAAVTEGGESCLVVDFYEPPIYSYKRR